MASHATTRRRAVLSALQDILTAGINGRTYSVVRGPVNYSSWPYQSAPLVCALLAAEFSLEHRSGSGFYRMDVVLELTTSVDPNQFSGLPGGPDDSELDKMALDAEVILDRLRVRYDDQGDPVVAAIVNDPEPLVREIYGADWRVQGLEFTFTVDY